MRTRKDEGDLPILFLTFSPVLLLQMGGHGEGRNGEEVKSKMEEEEEEEGRNKKKEVDYQVGFD